MCHGEKALCAGVNAPYALFSSPKLLLWRLKVDSNSIFAFRCSLQLVLALTRSNSLEVHPIISFISCVLSRHPISPVLQCIAQGIHTVTCKSAAAFLFSV